MESRSSARIQPCACACPTCGAPHAHAAPAPVISPPDDTPELTEPSDQFHPKRVLRIFLAMGIVFQAGIICFFGVLFSLYIYQPYYQSTFILELARLVTILYLFLFLYPAVIWFLSIYYNKPIPRTKTFLVCELIRAVPALLLSLGFLYFLLIAFISSLNYTIVYWPGIGIFILWVVSTIPAAFISGVALWSLVWLWFYFIKARREELQKLLGIGKKQEDEDPKGKAPERRPASRSIGRDDLESGEETPLLVDHAQMV